MEKLHEIPKNKVRKAFTLLYAIRQMERLLHQFAPIYNEDPSVIGLLKQMRAEYNTLMADLQSHPDYAELVKAHWEEYRSIQIQEARQQGYTSGDINEN